MYEVDYGDCPKEDFDKFRKIFKLDRLLPKDANEIHLWQYHTYQAVQSGGKDWPNMWKWAMPGLPARLMRNSYSPPKFRMAEWIGFKPMRFLSEKFIDYRDSHTGWAEFESSCITERLHLPLEKEAPSYGSVFRLNDECEYLETVYPKVGGLLDQEVIKDLTNNSPKMGKLEVCETATWEFTRKTVWSAVQECIEDIRNNTKIAGQAFAILPPKVAAIMAMEEDMTGGEISLDKNKKCGSIFWGMDSSRIKLYSHPFLTEKILVGVKPYDENQNGYIFRPYSFGLFGGIEDSKYKDNPYYNRMQLVLRRMKRLINVGNGLYGTILYNPTEPEREGRRISVPLIRQMYPLL